MANIMSQIKLRNKPSRNGFDLSKKNAFTAKVGELLPVYCKEVLPGDKFNISAKWLTRTQPVNTAAYTRIREYYDFFFVPTTLLWNRFGTFVTNQLGNSQRASRISGSDTMIDKQPYFTVNQIVSYLTSVSSLDNEFGFNRAYLTSKLLHYLGYGNFEGSWGTSGLAPRVNAELNPFPLLAYQKIYQDYFRNQQWEAASPQTYNVDYINGHQGTSTNIPVSDIPASAGNMFDLNYCNWNKDYFMGLLPNSQYGEASIIEPTTASYLEGIGIRTNQSGDVATSTVTATPYTYSLTVGGNNALFGLTQSSMQKLQDSLGDFTILALRQAQAKQKWAEITQSQRQDYKSQTEAHFGVSMSDAYSDYCTYIGGINSNVDISEVVNTNITGTNESDIAGKGVGVGQGGVNFEAKVHGYIMCIYHAVPLLDYSMTGIKRQNLKTTFMDYAVPEFDATGMVQVPLVELTNTKITGLSDTALLGYAPRYVDYKTDIDEVHGAFYNGGLTAWVAPLDDAYIKSYIEEQGASSFSGLNYRFLKVSPSVVNPIFGVDAGDTTATDQLLVNAYFDVKAVRNLDVNGLPY